MTKWIDEYAESLGADASSDNVRRQDDLSRDRLIQQHGPKFFEKLTDALRAQAAELDERVGASLKGITASDDKNRASILVVSGDRSVSLRCTSDYSARTMLAVTNRGNVDAAAKERTFTIAVNAQTSQISLRADPGPDVYEDAVPLATKLLREAFTGQWAD